MCRINIIYLHLDVKDTSLLLNLLLNGSHGLVKDRQALCALQSGRGHHIARWSNQVYLSKIRQCWSNSKVKMTSSQVQM